MAHRLDNLRTERQNAGHAVSRLAQLANVSDRLIKSLEDGGTCSGDEAARIAAALGVSLATLGKADA
jgi:Helix-turn-helix.